jgi:hypothetical protein
VHGYCIDHWAVQQAGSSAIPPTSCSVLGRSAVTSTSSPNVSNRPVRAWKTSVSSTLASGAPTQNLTSSRLDRPQARGLVTREISEGPYGRLTLLLEAASPAECKAVRAPLAR